MMSDSGASSHFIDNRLLAGKEGSYLRLYAIDCPVAIHIPGDKRLHGLALETYW